ncbi:DUF6468 domain-containing protein [Gimibacter soli]|uniref:DUF6468 domain-containing protein n=1 Tax=Gimibacter soli TaxID=3024400 RepID=A0AAE9XN03_9PROT|nr:DUF6468 domain-containing protein [Gimibacter soli]WCL53032.1 DUF6468 domain-containing protein [Gimibacter soli]
MAGLIVDGVLALLLVLAIVSCWVVYARLGTIREGQAELKALTDRLNNAVVDAQRGIANLKHSAQEMEGKLGGEVRKARALSDELKLITEAGNNLADRIERGLTGGNTQSASAPQAVPAEEPEKAAGSRQQKEILAALREAR